MEGARAIKKRVHDGSSGNRLLQEAYEAIMLQPPMNEDTSASEPTETSASAPSPSAPTEYIVFFSPVNKNNRWNVRCGKIDYADLAIPADAVAQTSAAAEVGQTSNASSSSAKGKTKTPK